MCSATSRRRRTRKPRPPGSNRFGPDLRRWTQTPPGKSLTEIYRSFVDDDAVLADLDNEAKPRVVSFHFGLPSAEARSRRCAMPGSRSWAGRRQAWRRREGSPRQANIDGIIAQGYEAGGHRGVFNTPKAADDRLGTMALTRILVREIRPADHRRRRDHGRRGHCGGAARLGAAAAQLGTFVGCDEKPGRTGVSRAPCSARGRAAYDDDGRQSLAGWRAAWPTASPAPAPAIRGTATSPTIQSPMTWARRCNIPA